MKRRTLIAVAAAMLIGAFVACVKVGWHEHRGYYAIAPRWEPTCGVSMYPPSPDDDRLYFVWGYGDHVYHDSFTTEHGWQHTDFSD